MQFYSCIRQSLQSHWTHGAPLLSLLATALLLEREFGSWTWAALVLFQFGTMYRTWLSKHWEAAEQSEVGKRIVMVVQVPSVRWTWKYIKLHLNLLWLGHLPVNILKIPLFITPNFVYWKLHTWAEARSQELISLKVMSTYLEPFKAREEGKSFYPFLKKATVSVLPASIIRVARLSFSLPQFFISTFQSFASLSPPRIRTFFKWAMPSLTFTCNDEVLSQQHPIIIAGWISF